MSDHGIAVFTPSMDFEFYPQCKWNLYSDLQDSVRVLVLDSLWPHSLFYPLLTWLQSYWPTCCSLKTTGMFLPQNLCTCCLHCLECSSDILIRLLPLPLGLYSNITFTIVCKIEISLFLPLYYLLSSFSALFFFTVFIAMWYTTYFIYMLVSFYPK